MTQNRRSKRATRARMAETGEKYTDARRALLASGGDGGHLGGNPDTTFASSGDSLGWFSDQAYNLILLPDDEARMLSHPTVEPEHLLLATIRHGNVQRLLGGNPGPAIQHAIERIKGFGDKLELRPRRSAASEEVLGRAVTAANARGIRDPSTEHLLLALAEQELPARLLAEIGVPDAEALVDTKYPARPPIHPAIVQRRAAQLAEMGSTPPSPGPIPPVFERFTAHARDAVRAGVANARMLDDPYVEPFHLLLAALNADGIAATVHSRLGYACRPSATARDLDVTTSAMPQTRGPRATDIFSDAARRIVAEAVLIIAERLEHRPLTTGHLLIAILESPDERGREIMSSLPDVREMTAAVIDALPSEPEA
jgi:ATP-dependent Clp protease ATP-binding subunit ClpA